MPAGLRTEAVAAAAAIGPPRDWDQALAAIAVHLPADERRSVLVGLLDVVARSDGWLSSVGAEELVPVLPVDVLAEAVSANSVGPPAAAALLRVQSWWP